MSLFLRDHKFEFEESTCVDLPRYKAPYYRKARESPPLIGYIVSALLSSTYPIQHRVRSNIFVNKNTSLKAISGYENPQ